MKFYVKKWITHAISSTPCFVLSSFCCSNLAKHQTLEQSSSSTSSIPWRHGLLSVARITVALSDSCASKSCLQPVYFTLSPEWSFCNGSDCVSPLLEILYGLLIVFRIKNPSSLVWKITCRDLVSSDQSPTWSFDFSFKCSLYSRHTNQLHFSECSVFLYHWNMIFFFPRHAFLCFLMSSTNSRSFKTPQSYL